MQANGQLLGGRSAAVRWAFGLWAVVIAVFVIIAIPTLRDLAEPIDAWFWDLAVETEWQPAVFVAKALRIIGSAWVMVPIEIGVCAWLITRRRWHILVFWAAAIGLTEATVWISKAIYQEPRPPDALVSTTGYSFPSAHSATAGVVSIALVLVFASIARNRWHWFVAAAAWTIAMMAGRVYLRAHWLTDVIAGAALGAAVALSVALLVDRRTSRGGDRQNGPADE